MPRTLTRSGQSSGSKHDISKGNASKQPTKKKKTAEKAASKSTSTPAPAPSAPISGTMCVNVSNALLIPTRREAPEETPAVNTPAASTAASSSSSPPPDYPTLADGKTPDWTVEWTEAQLKQGRRSSAASWATNQKKVKLLILICFAEKCCYMKKSPAPAIKKGERSDHVTRNQSDSKMHILCKTQHAVKIRFTFSGVYDAR
jgi:hypothetical protein